jgi:hypothetical protein
MHPSVEPHWGKAAGASSTDEATGNGANCGLRACNMKFTLRPILHTKPRFSLCRRWECSRFRYVKNERYPASRLHQPADQENDIADGEGAPPGHRSLAGSRLAGALIRNCVPPAPSPIPAPCGRPLWLHRIRRRRSKPAWARPRERLLGVHSTILPLGPAEPFASRKASDAPRSCRLTGSPSHPRASRPDPAFATCPGRSTRSPSRGRLADAMERRHRAARNSRLVTGSRSEAVPCRSPSRSRW